MMHTIKRWLHHDRDDALREPLNVDGLLAEGLRDRGAARAAIERLGRERGAIVKSQRALAKQSKALTSGTVRGIVRGTGVSELQAQQLSHAMRRASDAAGSPDQLLALEERLAAIDRARSQLYAYLDQHR